MDSLTIQWRSGSQLPRINGERYRWIRYGEELRFNSGVPKFNYENEEYGCFFTRHNPYPPIQGIHPLEILENRYHTYYFTSLSYDGNPYYHVIFAYIDTLTKRIYESRVIGRAHECRIEINPNTKGFDFYVGDSTTPIHVDVYQTKMESVRICADITQGM